MTFLFEVPGQSMAFFDALGVDLPKLLFQVLNFLLLLYLLNRFLFRRVPVILEISLRSNPAPMDRQAIIAEKTGLYGEAVLTITVLFRIDGL